MFIQKVLCTWFLLLFTQCVGGVSLTEQLNRVGYVEICDTCHGTAMYDSLYACFDELITFFQTNEAWAQKLYCAKERFIRSKNRNYYSTDFFGFYDESERVGRNQISFYYSVHFHDFIFSQYPEFKHVPQITNFFEICFEIQQASNDVLNDIVVQLGLENMYSSEHGHFATLKSLKIDLPILLKVVQYLPSYSVSRPHYDGTALSLFLDSTDNQSLLLSPYKSAFTVEDFFSPVRKFPRGCNQNSSVLIPGTLLTDFFLYPTPHIVRQSGKTRYATIAFAMRPDYTCQKNNFSLLPDFKY